MSNQQVFVGLDYHQNTIQVCVVDGKGQVVRNRSVANDVSGIVEVARSAGEVRGVTVEACSGSADLVEALLRATGWSVELAHPGYVSRLKRSPDKSDWSDARLLADLGRVGYVPRVWLRPTEIGQLRELVRYRQQWVDHRRTVKLRVRALLRDHRVRAPSGVGAAWSRSWRDWLSGALKDLGPQSCWVMERHLAELGHIGRQIAEVERRLHEVTESDPVVAQLRSHRGVGPVTAWVLRAEIGCFGRFGTGKQLARYCSVSPRNASSGQRQADAGLIKAGSPLLRSTLIELAHRLMWGSGRWAALGARLRRNGKPGSVVAAAVANRWVRWLYYQMVDTAA